VLRRSWKISVTGDPCPPPGPAREYGVDDAFMLKELHEIGIHAV